MSDDGSGGLIQTYIKKNDKFLSGTITDSNSFDKDGTRSGSLGYYPMDIGGGQIRFLPCLDRLRFEAIESIGSTIGTAIRGALQTVTPKEFGAVGNNVADDTIALNLAANAARARKLPLVLDPNAVYKVTGPIDLRGEGLVVRGGSGAYNGATIRSYNNNAPIVLVGGTGMQLHDILLTYNTQPTVTDIKAVAVMIYAWRRARSTGVRIDKAYIGMAIAAEAANSDPTQLDANFVYSIQFDSWVITRYTGWALYLAGFNGGNTGIVFNNLYTTNILADRSYIEADGCIHLGTFSEIIFNQLNIEGLAWRVAPFQTASDTNSVTINALHMESLEPHVAGRGLFQMLGGTTIIVNGMALTSLNLSATLMNGTSFQVARMNINSQTTVS